MTPEFAVIGLVVTDMAKSLAFYRRLGLDLPADADSQPHVDVELPGGLRLTWDTVETIHSFYPSWSKPHGGSPQMGLAFRCATPADVDTVYNELVGAGYEGHLEPMNAFWGQRYATVHDPDGNGVDLFSQLAN